MNTWDNSLDDEELDGEELRNQLRSLKLQAKQQREALQAKNVELAEKDIKLKKAQGAMSTSLCCSIRISF